MTQTGARAPQWIVVVVFAVLFVALTQWIAPLSAFRMETAAYDQIVKALATRPGSDIAIVAIDDSSIDNIGRWPWSRDILAKVIDQLAQGGAKLIVPTLILSEPELDPGWDKLLEVRQSLNEPPLATSIANASQPLHQPLRQLAQQVDQSIASLNYDAALGAAISNAKNVVLPVNVSVKDSFIVSQNDTRKSTLINANHTKLIDPNNRIATVSSLSPPVSEIGLSAAGMGHVFLMLDDDGHIRQLPLFVRYKDNLLPSLALTTALLAQDYSLSDIEAIDDSRMRLGNHVVFTDANRKMRNHFYADIAGKSAFSIDSFYEVFSGQIPVDKYRGKIVLIGARALGVEDQFPTPVSVATPPVDILANQVSSLMRGHSFAKVNNSGWINLAAIFVLSLFLAFALPRMKPLFGVVLSIIIVVLLLFAELWFFAEQATWVPLITSIVFLVSGHAIMSISRLGVVDRMRSTSEAESAESNRMLGLAFQNQGQLDMAFEKFQKCPMNPSMMNVLYNLALDYERKRQFNKASVVYRQMAEFNPKYKDIRSRMDRNISMEKSAVLSSGKQTHTEFLVGDANIQAPRLGRYVIDKVIGQGAMGTVYLGRDPKINREVAIKTIPLAEEFDKSEIDNAKARFFREAETAGSLNHPNIVTIFDAGEEHDLAYIAMEFLRGEHLNNFTTTKTLLPVSVVTNIVATVAGALHYAHEEGVIHRDIKPGNIIFDRDENEIKITDFGIARITGSSKTKTGIVLGTPSYMSPEQLAGKKVTGRSDLFSLGVTLYQLLAGQLPFQADSIATLMYKIANEPHTELGVVRPDLHDCLAEVINQALAKNPADRMASGAEMALMLRECAASLESEA